MTDQLKHTPGPWTAEVEETNRGGWSDPVQNVKIASEKHLIAFYQTSYVEYPDDDANAANARLMAAAPDLLAALKRMVEVGSFSTEAWLNAQAVIAKAEARVHLRDASATAAVSEADGRQRDMEASRG